MSRHVFPRSFHTDYLEAAYGEGIYIIDSSGRRYIDGCSGALISNLGHAVPEIADAIAAQARKLEFMHSSRWRGGIVEEAAAAVAGMAPADLNRVWFVSGGSEANESALKLARQYYVERDGVNCTKHLTISRWNSYHGNTLATMAVGGSTGRRRPFSPMFTDSPKIEPHYCYRCSFGLAYPACDLRCARQLESTIKKIGAHYISSFLAEPVVGAAIGALPPPEGYWPLVREICGRHDILLIADEVMCGCGRTGKAFAVEHWDVIPDILVMAKGLAAGYVPTGGIAVRDCIADAICNGSGSFAHGHSYQGNPMSAAATLACLNYMRKNKVMDNVLGLEALFREGLRQIESDSPIVGQMRGKGFMWGGEFVRDKASRATFGKAGAAAQVVAKECLDRGLIIYPGGGMIDGDAGDNFLLGPPLVATRDQVLDILERLAAGIKAAEARLL